jgi:hypothetical protein
MRIRSTPDQNVKRRAAQSAEAAEEGPNAAFAADHASTGHACPGEPYTPLSGICQAGKWR